MSKEPAEEEPSDIEDLFPLVCDGIAAKLGIPPRWEREWTQEEQDRISAEFDSPDFTLSDDLFDPPQTGHPPGQQ
jgi:hypothetical protein